ncbi:MAG: hypothetical protein GWP19_05035 [Planctomycetia bacterium]|nr:hypothetical protein [Planctomycetia bacterium]
MKFETKMKVMMIVMLTALFFLSMWIISDTRLFIGLMVFATFIRYEDRVKKTWHDYDIL